MAKRPADDRQLTLDGYFRVPPAPGQVPASLDFEQQWRRALNTAIKESGKTRAEICANMTDLIYGEDGEGEITKMMLDARTAPSRDAYAFPITWLPAFVKATGAVWLLDIVADKCGCVVLYGEEAVLAQLGAVLLEKQAATTREKELRKAVGDGVYERLLGRLRERGA